jgi:hypothetical protein
MTFVAMVADEVYPLAAPREIQADGFQACGIHHCPRCVRTPRWSAGDQRAA